VGRIGVAVAAGAQRMFAIIAAQPDGGLYRSDDGGENCSAAPRTLASPAAATSEGLSRPQNPDVVYVMQTSMYRSAMAATIYFVQGAPGGDDNHVLWIDPRIPTG